MPPRPFPKRFWKIGLLLIVLLAMGTATLLPEADNIAKITSEETRALMKAEGYKLDLAEFDLTTPTELRERAKVLTEAGTASILGRRDWLDAISSVQDSPTRAIWKVTPEELVRSLDDEDSGRLQNYLIYELKGDRTVAGLWTALEKDAQKDQKTLNDACDAILSGRIRFELLNGRRGTILLPHLAPIKQLAGALQTRLILDLYRGNSTQAWTDLLALTKLVTNWEVEPAKISRHVQYTCTSIAFEATWQALQSDHWFPEQLATLQNEWETLVIFDDLSETAALERADMLAILQTDRTVGPTVGSSSLFQDFRHSPIGAVRGEVARLRSIQQEKEYQKSGTYEDETALLLYFRDRENDLKRATTYKTWLDMQQVSGATNLVPFSTKNPSRIGTIMNLKQLGNGMAFRGKTLLMKAAETETRRRIILTAIALERYQKRHSFYPKSLNELVPDFLSQPPEDFMDGNPLRYRVENQSFKLWSVGLDGAEGGEGENNSRDRFPEEARFRRDPQRTFRIHGADIVWPSVFE